MTSVSARLPESLEDELEEFVEEEKLDKSTAIRKLISEGLENWRREKAMELLEKGETTFSRAADIAGMDLWSFSNLLKEREIPWVKDKHAREDLERF